jgi:hypothetical protein
LIPRRIYEPCFLLSMFTRWKRAQILSVNRSSLPLLGCDVSGVGRKRNKMKKKGR